MNDLIEEYPKVTRDLLRKSIITDYPPTVRGVAGSRIEHRVITYANALFIDYSIQRAYHIVEGWEPVDACLDVVNGCCTGSVVFNRWISPTRKKRGRKSVAAPVGE